MALAFFEARDARSRVRAETMSGVQMGRLLAASAIGHAAREPTPELAMLELARELPPAVRHLSLTVERGAPVDGAVPTPRTTAVPAWFANLIDAPPLVERYPVVVDGAQIGAVVLTSSPDDEIAEVWLDWKNEMAMIAALSAAIIMVVIAAVGMALRPLSALAQAFDRLEGGDFAVRVKPVADPQLRRLAQRFNSLAASLEQATADNRLLINRLMSVQEAERKDVAHELHDEYGPSLFAIRADLGAISRWVRKREPRFEEIQERLLSISGLVAQIQRINSRLLERLRPLAIGQMRLHEALQGLISDWRARYPDLTWTVGLQPVADLSEEAEHALYRAAQECMTNVVRHSGATAVEVRLAQVGGEVGLLVEDNGKGIEDGQPFGFGLLGMTERTRAVGGRMHVSRGQSGGARVEVVVPAGKGVA